MTMPPNTPGSMRRVPRRPSEEQRGRLRQFVEQDRCWVLRYNWEAYLQTGDSALLVPISSLTRDHRSAAISWLRQQRHRLHAALRGDRVAPEGWLETLPLYRALARREG